MVIHEGHQIIIWQSSVSFRSKVLLVSYIRRPMCAKGPIMIQIIEANDKQGIMPSPIRLVACGYFYYLNSNHE